MSQIKILWVDDEIDLLKPHILFLEKKNYNVTTYNNGRDAIDAFEDGNFDFAADFERVIYDVDCCIFIAVMKVKSVES